jgi:hypothetical protein
MIVNVRKFLRILTYKTVFFPTVGEAADIVTRLRTTDLARCFWTTAPYENDSMIEAVPSATVCLDLRKPVEELWNGITRNSRNEVRSVERLGSQVRVARDGADTRRDFLKLYSMFAEAKPDAARFRPDMLEPYGPHADTFVIYLDDQPMCAHAFLVDAAVRHARLIFSASRRLEDKVSSRVCGSLNRLLHWQEINSYHADGLLTYDLGGVREDPGDGIARFKSSFGGVRCREYTSLYAGSPMAARLAQFAIPFVKGRSGQHVTGEQSPVTITNHAEQP